MKTVQRYIRETRGTVCADRAKARECEKGRHAPERIVRMRYAAVHSDKTGCPQTIEVLMSDGKTATCKRTGGQ